MKVTYSLMGEPDQVFDFDPDRVRVSEAEIMEKRYGGTWTELRAGITQGNAKARRVLLWHLLRRTHHTLRYEDTPDFAFGDVKVEHEIHELAAMRDKIAKSNHARKDELLSALDVEIAEAEETEVPKAITNNGDSSE